MKIITRTGAYSEYRSEYDDVTRERLKELESRVTDLEELIVWLYTAQGYISNQSSGRFYERIRERVLRRKTGQR